jgi:hypothetical protein
LLSVPPNRNSVPPRPTVVLLAVALVHTVWVPLARTVSPIATPPEDTVIEPPEMKSPLATPPV